VTRKYKPWPVEWRPTIFFETSDFAFDAFIKAAISLLAIITYEPIGDIIAFFNLFEADYYSMSPTSFKHQEAD